MTKKIDFNKLKKKKSSFISNQGGRSYAQDSSDISL